MDEDNNAPIGCELEKIGCGSKRIFLFWFFLFGLGLACGILIHSFLSSNINSDVDLVSKFQDYRIDGYNGTFYGGYSCYQTSGGFFECYFNPIDSNEEEVSLGCGKNLLRFSCNEKAKYCFLFSKFERVEGGVFECEE